MLNNNFENRTFLMLQGPQSLFFKDLAQELERKGAKVIKIQFCGGDVFLWNICGKKIKVATKTLFFRQKASLWPEFIAKVYKEYNVTDILLYSDWRPLHQNAILIAKDLDIDVWVYEEGYLRRGFSTLEKDGVNGRSSLPKNIEEVIKLGKELPKFEELEHPLANPVRNKVIFAIYHHVGNVLLYPIFYRYKTHRQHNIFRELFGIIPRYLTRKRRYLKSIKTLRFLSNERKKFFFYPLQLNSDSQVQLYSPYLRQEEAITYVISSFARYADKNTCLLIKNHPLDNGLIPYRDYIFSMAEAYGVRDRVFYIEDGNHNMLISKCRGVVLINSTVGISAILKHKKVFCLGTSIYALPNIAYSMQTSNIDDFWEKGVDPDPEYVEYFFRVLREKSLIEGNYYGKDGAFCACHESIKRFAESKK